MIDRDKVLEYATKYWWRPCADGKVWVASRAIFVAEEAKVAKAAKAKAAKDGKAEDYVGAFLWYPTADGKDDLEGLFLVPKSKESEIEKADDDDRSWAKFKDVAIALASYKNDPKDKKENRGLFKPEPPYHGLNDCTHFTSECLIAGGFPVVTPKDVAKRGAGDLAFYLQASTKEVTTLCWMAAHDDVKAVVDAGIVKVGDVFAYHANEKTQYAHHTVPAVSPTTIAMHTEHAFGLRWDLGGTKERYSLFHFFKDDDYKSADPKWVGWWKVEVTGDPKRTKPEYYYLHGNGDVTVTSKAPDEKTKPEKPSSRWFSTKPKTAVVVRRNDKVTTVETFTLEDSKDPKVKDPPVTAGGTVSRPAKTSSKGTKLF